MTAQISPRMRVIAIAGLAAALLMGSATFLMGRADATVASDPPALASVLPLPKEAPAAQEAAPAAEPVAPAAPEEAKEQAPLVDPTLPAPIAAALKRSRSVVVALHLAGARVDALALAEAQRGAGDAGVAFVALDALGDHAGPLAEKLGGIVDAPAVLVFNRPGDLVFKVEGFADRAMVAQAAASALRGKP